MVSPKRSLLSAAVLLALAASPAHAVLERMGPISKAPTVGGFPSWFQDKTGITLEFCDPLNASELNGGWCTVLDGVLPENFPLNYGPEHFYYAAVNDMRDAGTGMRAKLVLAMEAAFANNFPAEGDQVTFGRLRVVIPNLPFDGDYRVITPYSDKTYPNMTVGGKISDTLDIGLGCVNTFECTLKTPIGPYLLPSPFPGGNEVPAMPELKSAPPGTDPYYDALLALGGATADPQTGRKYLADPGRVGPVTGSPLPNFTAFETNGTTASRNHNTFRIEVRTPGDGAVFYTMEGESNFTVAGRLLTGTLPGKVTPTRASYKADGVGNMTDLDVFATASPTTQARLPAQPQLPPVMPVLSYFDQPCANSLIVNPETGLTVVNAPQFFGAPTGTSRTMAQSGSTFWGQNQPTATGAAPSHVCLMDSAARDANGQTVPAYYLQRVTDTVRINAADYDGPGNGTLSVSAISSDPTAKLTLIGFGPAAPGTPGRALATAPGTGLDLALDAATVTGLMASPATVQVASSKGGLATHETETARGMATGTGGGGGGGGGGNTPPVIGTPVAVNETATVFEDCSQAAASMCGAGMDLAVDLLGNDTITVNGTAMTLRNFVRQGLGTATVSAQAPRLGLANITSDGIISYVPNPNANGTDSISYTVTVDGKVSNQGLLTITITPVNDTPSAGNTSGGGVVTKPATLNLLANSTDPDGPADLKDAVIISWPTQLGTRPTPVNGVVSFTPTTAGTYNIVYQVKDAAGVVSPNTATGSVTVLAAETITPVQTQFTPAALRWRINGTDTVRAGQTLTIVYGDGKTRSGITCSGLIATGECLIGTAIVDAAGGWSLDKIIAAGTAQDPTSTGAWQRTPSRVRIYSSEPVLGGSANGTILVK
ncbi:hypothetical protein GCM10028796_55440 [Ramlibacter monticola]|uniref:Tandem-95 repeat protein n=1 Tax=Ramlibacter monticola TaxID=1926872 RepID=A0A936Z4M5_9BURK|nr:Ig-like domain-containing protein [Ramlibacter monticola]MBL0394929.1 hypothetical protein [Ramlibacter monticola]